MRALISLTALTMLGAGAVRAADPPEDPIGAEFSVENGTLVVDNVAEGGPAAKAGVKAGDVIVRINDLVVKEEGLTARDVQAVGNEIGKHRPGDKIRLTVKRAGKEHRLVVTVGK